MGPPKDCYISVCFSSSSECDGDSTWYVAWCKNYVQLMHIGKLVSTNRSFICYVWAVTDDTNSENELTNACINVW